MFKSTKLLTMAGAGGLLAIAGFAVPVHADTVTDSFNVLIEILDSCTIENGGPADVDFGQVASSDLATVAEQTTTIAVECNPLSDATIALTPSNSDTTGAGAMAYTGPGTSSDTISYQLSQSTGTTTVWGNVVGTNTVSVTGDLTAGPQTFTIYTNVTDSGPKASGTYSDTVTVDVTY